MLDGLAKIGDKVFVNIDEQHRGWAGKDEQGEERYPFPDGTEAVVCGFYDAVIFQGRTEIGSRKPGVYHSLGAVSVMLQDGKVITGLSDSWLELVDKIEGDRRYAEYCKLLKEEGGYEKYWRGLETRLGDLPPTHFWEGDKVRLKEPAKISDYFGGVLTITIVGYSWMHQKRVDKSPMPIYTVRDEVTNGPTTSVSDSEIELVERGNIWKYEHLEPLSFSNLAEEAGFWKSIGHTTDVKNLSSGNYAWTREEALDAIRKGIAHGFSVFSGFFNCGPSISVLRFKDEELGERVRKATLEANGLIPA